MVVRGIQLKGLFIGTIGGEKAYVLVHVDDVLIVGPEAAVRSTKRRIASLFDVRDLGAASLFLGLEIVYNKSTGTLWLGQSKYTANKLM